MTISANDPSFAVGDQGVYVNELKGSIALSWGYMRKGTVVVLVSTINDVDQRTSIQQQLSHALRPDQGRRPLSGRGEPVDAVRSPPAQHRRSPQTFT